MYIHCTCVRGGKAGMCGCIQVSTWFVHHVSANVVLVCDLSQHSSRGVEGVG